MCSQPASSQPGMCLSRQGLSTDDTGWHREKDGKRVSVLGTQKLTTTTAVKERCAHVHVVVNRSCFKLSRSTWGDNDLNICDQFMILISWNITKYHDISYIRTVILRRDVGNHSCAMLCQAASLNLYFCRSPVENGGDGSRDHRCHIHLQLQLLHLWRFHQKIWAVWAPSDRHTRVSRNLWRSCAICIDAKSVITTCRVFCFCWQAHVSPLATWLPSKSALTITYQYTNMSNLYILTKNWMQIVRRSRLIQDCP